MSGHRKFYVERITLSRASYVVYEIDDILPIAYAESFHEACGIARGLKRTARFGNAQVDAMIKLLRATHE